MSSEPSEVVGRILFFVLIMSLFADIVLRAAWNKMYFTIGIPIFVKRISVNVQHKSIPFQYLFEGEFPTHWTPALTFHPLDSSTYGFREKYFQICTIKYFPIMHGLLIFEREQQRVVVKGIASWFTIWFVVYFSLLWLNLMASFPIHFTDPVAFIILVLVACYVIQYLRFSKVCKVAAQLWSIKHFSPGGGA